MNANNGYLARLMLGLTIGAAQLDEPIRRRHLNYVLQRQQPDGGWGGREGDSDLYYTSFALRTLAILGQLQGDLAEHCSSFLRSRLSTNESIVDLLSLVYSAKLIQASCDLDPLSGCDQPWQSRLANLLGSLRRQDGGYSKSIEGKASSTYQTFLALICLELIEMPVPKPEATAEFLLKQRQADGGFLEIRVAKRSGTNPTAAALGGLSVLGRIDQELENSATEFLLELQSDEGGFQANSRIPMADLLSTFTAVVTLSDLGSISLASIPAIRNFVQSMEITSGGFHGFQFDQGDDVEYTFYGLGSLALLRLANGPTAS